MNAVVNIWTADRATRRVCLLKESDNIIEKVKSKFSITGDATLVMERDGSCVDPEFEVLHLLAGAKETLLILKADEHWSDAVTEENVPGDSVPAQASTYGINPVLQEPALTNAPFTNVQSLQQYIAEHPNGKSAAKDLQSGNVTSKSRQLIVRLAVHKMVDLFGNYPNKAHVSQAASMLGQLLEMPATVFYDPKSFDGFVPRCLQNLRRNLSHNDKRYSWSRKRKTPSTELSAQPALGESSSGSANSGLADVDTGSCPRNVKDCSLCRGKDSNAERDRFKLLSFQRLEDIREAAVSTFCHRRRWIEDNKPLVADILRNYPKFQSNPQLLDFEFCTLAPDCADFLLDFPAVMTQLWKYCRLSPLLSVQQTVSSAAAAELDWQAWYAVKTLCLLMRPSVKKRISGAEAISSICRVIPTGRSLESECQQLPNSPVLLIQGDFGGPVASVKVATEQVLFEAGSTIMEGLDRLFKIFWICNMEYPTTCANIFNFLEHFVYKMQSRHKMPPTVVELCGFLRKQ